MPIFNLNSYRNFHNTYAFILFTQHMANFFATLISYNKLRW